MVGSSLLPSPSAPVQFFQAETYLSSGLIHLNRERTMMCIVQSVRQSIDRLKERWKVVYFSFPSLLLFFFRHPSLLSLSPPPVSIICRLCDLLCFTLTPSLPCFFSFLVRQFTPLTCLSCSIFSWNPLASRLHCTLSIKNGTLINANYCLFSGYQGNLRAFFEEVWVLSSRNPTLPTASMAVTFIWRAWREDNRISKALWAIFFGLIHSTMRVVVSHRLLDLGALCIKALGSLFTGSMGKVEGERRLAPTHFFKTWVLLSLCLSRPTRKAVTLRLPDAIKHAGTSKSSRFSS